MIRILLALVATAPLFVPFPAAGAALEFQNYFLKRPVPGQRLLEPCAPTRDDERDETDGIPWLATAVYPPFFTAPDDVERIIPDGTATATLYLTTGPEGTMTDCADVTVQLARETPAGTFQMAAGTATAASIYPKLAGGLGNPVVVSIPVTGPEASRTLAVGDSLRMTVSVTNSCADQEGRQVALRFDSRSLASRLYFENVTVPDEGGAADPDGDGIPNLCDNCPEVSNVAQIDTNRDGLGDACTPCTPDGPVPPECACIGDGCDDLDQCTLDSCDAQLGCLNQSIPFLEGVRCRLGQLTDTIDNALPDDISSRLQRNRSPLKRKLRRAFKALGKAERAVLRNKPTPKVQRKIRKLRNVIAKFVEKVEAQRLKTRLSGRLRDTLVDQANRAIEATTDEQP